MAAWLWQRMCCCLTGHDYVITSDRTRMFLRCRTCGRTSHGLDLADRPLRDQAHPGHGALPRAGAAAGGSTFATR